MPRKYPHEKPSNYYNAVKLYPGQPPLHWPADRKFKPHYQKYKQVRGGRWSVRRVPFDEHQRNDGKNWRAWTVGKGKNYNKYFATQEEAIHYAQAIAFFLQWPKRKQEILDAHGRGR